MNTAKWAVRKWLLLQSVDQQVQIDFIKACYTVRRKGLATNHFTTNLQRGVTARYEKEKYRYPLLSTSYADCHL